MFCKKIVEKRGLQSKFRIFFFCLLYDFRTNEIKVMLCMYIQNTCY